MKAGQKKMMFSHPLMTVKHKLASLGVDYAKIQRDKNASDKQKESNEKMKAKIARATRSPKKSKSKNKRKK